MLPSRDLYKMVFEAHEKGLGAESLEDVWSGKKLYLIDDSLMGADETEKVLILFTNKFVLRVEQTIEFGDLYKESGEWRKDYFAQDVTKNYSGYPDKVSDDDIINWVKENSLEFLFKTKS